MGSAMRKMGVYLGLLEDTERYDDDYYDEYDEQPARRESREPVAHAGDRGEPARPAPVANIAERRRPQQGPAGVVAELSRITTLHPRTYNEARTIGENFREGVPVIMNLSEMDDDDAKRLVDFSAGLIFARARQHRAGHQQGVPALPAQRLGGSRGQAAHRRGRLLQPVVTHAPPNRTGAGTEQR